MKKSLLILCASVLALAAMAQRPVVNLKRASVDPVIDGSVDEVWSEAADTLNIELFDPENDPPTLGESGETTWRGLWTFEGIYILLEVNDDDFYPHYEVPGSNSWEYDKPELYFDVNWSLDDGLGPMDGQGHYQVAPAFADGLNDGTLQSCGFNGASGNIVEYAFQVDDPSYKAEYFIPFADLLDSDGLSVDITGEIGFDVTIIDRDEGDLENRGAVWVNTGEGDAGSSWENMDNSGIIVLEGADEAILIEEIVLTGGEITENNGTLQIGASILPAEATNTYLKWTVTSGTGKASIDKNGLLTGIIDGEVTVKAQATDDSYVEAEVTVNISNQITSLPEICVIKNPFFDDPDNSAPSEWDSYTDGSPAPVVIDGYVALQPQEAADEWRYAFSQSPLSAEPNIDYIFSFVAWADEAKSLHVDFEDTEENNWNRYGISSDPRSGWGRSDWTFDISDAPTKYTFDVNFDQILENTVQKLVFQMGTSGIITYLDSIILVSVDDFARITDYEPVQFITVSGAGGVEEVSLGNTLQMSAEVLPVEADYTAVRWSVVNGTGEASIDENGLLNPEASGTVTVVATALDDSGISGQLELNVTYPAGMDSRKITRLQIYPNPASDHLQVVFPIDVKSAGIYDLTGKLVMEFCADSREVQLDISSLPSGMYFIRSGKALGRFVK